MFACFVCALLGFRAREFPENSEKNPDIYRRPRGGRMILILVLPIKITSYFCILHGDAMDLPWNPYLSPKYDPQFTSVKKLKYDPVLGKLNDLVIMNFIKKGRDEE